MYLCDATLYSPFFPSNATVATNKKQPRRCRATLSLGHENRELNDTEAAGDYPVANLSPEVVFQIFWSWKVQTVFMLVTLEQLNDPIESKIHARRTLFRSFFLITGDTSMKLTKNILAASFAALLIGGLSVNSASAAVKSWGDLTLTTHGSIADEVNPFGPVTGQTYSRSDISAITHRGSAGVSTYNRVAANNYGWSDISSVTHN